MDWFRNFVIERFSDSKLKLDMDDLSLELSDVDDLTEDFSYTERLAQYYSDFPATDFKKVACQKDAFKHAVRRGVDRVSPSKNSHHSFLY